MNFAFQGPYYMLYGDVFVLVLWIESERDGEREKERMLAQNWLGELRQKVASSVILTLALQTWTHWASFFLRCESVFESKRVH